MIVRYLARSILLCTLPALWAGCSYVDTDDDPTLNQQMLDARSPRRMAIAPFYNESRVPDAARKMRVELYSELAPLTYDDVELDRFDAALNERAMTRNAALEELPPSFFLDPKLADAVVLGRVERVSRLVLLFYNHLRIDLTLLLVSTADGAYLYRNHFVIRNRHFTIPTSPQGILNSLWSTFWFFRSKGTDETYQSAAREIAQRFPIPATQASAGSTQIREAEVALPRPTLAAGEQVVVHVAGTPGRAAAFSLGDIARDVEMVESSPGNYVGFYQIRSGDNARFVFATVTLRNPALESETVTYQADDHPFTIDTIPPLAHRVDRWSQGPGAPGVKLFFTPEEPPADPSDRPAAYLVFRGHEGDAELEFLGRSETPEFEDASARIGVAYDYGVLAEDAAGNRSPMKSRARVTPQRVGEPAPDAPPRSP